jgi:hypothetical protein
MRPATRILTAVTMLSLLASPSRAVEPGKSSATSGSSARGKTPAARWEVAGDPVNDGPGAIPKGLKQSFPLGYASPPPIIPGPPGSGIVILREGKHRTKEYAVLDLRTGAVSKPIPNPDLADPVVSPDGKHLAARPNRFTGTHVWSAETGKDVLTVRAPDELNFTHIPITSEGQFYSLWDVTTGRRLRRSERLTATFVESNPHAASANGKLFATFSGSRIFVFDGRTLELLGVITTRENFALKGGIAFSPDGTELAVVAGGGLFDLRLLRFDLATGNQTLDGPKVRFDDWSKLDPVAGTEYLSGSRLLRFRDLILDAATGKPVTTLKPPPGKRLSGAVAGAADQVLIIYEEMFRTGKVEAVDVTPAPAPK